MDGEPDRLCREPKSIVMGCEHEVTELFAREHGAGQVDRIEGTQRRRKGFRSSIENGAIHRDQPQGIDGVDHGPALPCYRSIV
jgi:hypothetical protein